MSVGGDVEHNKGHHWHQHEDNPKVLNDAPRCFPGVVPRRLCKDCGNVVGVGGNISARVERRQRQGISCERHSATLRQDCSDVQPRIIVQNHADPTSYPETAALSFSRRVVAMILQQFAASFLGPLQFPSLHKVARGY